MDIPHLHINRLLRCLLHFTSFHSTLLELTLLYFTSLFFTSLRFTFPHVFYFNSLHYHYFVCGTLLNFIQVLRHFIVPATKLESLSYCDFLVSQRSVQVRKLSLLMYTTLHIYLYVYKLTYILIHTYTHITLHIYTYTHI